MKKRIRILCIILVLILVIPMPISPLKDGGTREFVALTYKVVIYRHLYGEGEGYKQYKAVKVYLFPDNFTDIGELIDREMEKVRGA